MIFSLIILFAAVHLLQRAPQPVRGKGITALLDYLKTAGAVFGILAALYGAGFFFKQGIPSYADAAPGFLLLFAFLLGKPLKLSEPLRWVSFCAWAYLAPQVPSLAFSKITLISFGVPLLEWVFDGIEFRLFLTSSFKPASLPALLFLLSLIALIGSGFFICSS